MQIALIIIAIILAIVLIACIIATWVKKNKVMEEIKSREASGVVVKDETRYSKETTITSKDGNQEVSFLPNDIILKPRQPEIVSKKGNIKPGKYTILSTKEGETKFNLRINNNVKILNHSDEIVLIDGEEVSSTTTTLILR
ncbi:MAG: hypothetical protein RR334_02690 [Clostridia bacterium]